ncbi:MAG: hypothetical protein AAF611_23025 [Bacteroidota bacterium]
MAGLNDPLLSIDNWSALAKEAPNDGIISLFAKSGNSFPLTLNETMKDAERLHIYLGFNTSETIEFYVIPADMDETSNKSIDTCGVSTPLDATQQKITSSSKSPLVGWVNNWCDAGLRNGWLTSLEQAVQVFVIHTTDFVVNDLHKCYLALKPNTKEVGTYRVDLVIQNTVTGQFLNVEEPPTSDTLGTPQFADMARPVPPYNNGYNLGHPSTEATNFGILQQL